MTDKNKKPKMKVEIVNMDEDNKPETPTPEDIKVNISISIHRGSLKSERIRFNVKKKDEMSKIDTEKAYKWLAKIIDDLTDTLVDGGVFQ